MSVTAPPMPAPAPVPNPGTPPAPAPTPAGAAGTAPPADPIAAHFTQILMNPAFQAMSPEHRSTFLQQQVQQAKEQHAAGTSPTPPETSTDASFAQSLASPKASPKRGLARLTPPSDAPMGPALPTARTPAAGAHPLEAALRDPTADHAKAIENYVYG